MISKEQAWDLVRNIRHHVADVYIPMCVALAVFCAQDDDEAREKTRRWIADFSELVGAISIFTDADDLDDNALQVLGMTAQLMFKMKDSSQELLDKALALT